MTHYGISQWIDFARGLASAEDAQAMRDHLAEGCDECSDLSGFCESLSRVCEAMAARPVPEWLARSAKAMFPAPAAAVERRVVRIPARLVYDSFLAPAPAGLRASWQTGWQALYRAGHCSLDLRVEPELSSSKAAVIGQISNFNTPDDRMENVPVVLKSGKSVVAETRSNRFGEFQMEYDQAGRLQLYVHLEDGAKCFQVPLKKLSSDRPAAGDRLGLLPAKGKAGTGRE